MSPKFARFEFENKNHPGSGLSYVILIKIGVCQVEGETIQPCAFRGIWRPTRVFVFPLNRQLHTQYLLLNSFNSSGYTSLTTFGNFRGALRVTTKLVIVSAIQVNKWLALESIFIFNQVFTSRDMNFYSKCFSHIMLDPHAAFID